MNKAFIKILVANLIFFQILIANASETKNKIAVLVNDTVISNYDIEQRIKIFSILNKVQVTPENSNVIANRIVDELIDSVLKNEKIIEFEIKVPTSDFNNYENQYFSRRNINKEEIFKLMEINNVNENQFYDMLYTDIAWQILISKRYYRVTAVPDEEIKRLVKSDPEISDELAEKMIVDKQLSLKSSKMLRDLRSEATIEYR